MDLGLKQRTALVLGTTSGLGRGIARSLVREGANVVGTGRTVRADEVLDASDNYRFVKADLLDHETPGRLVAAAEECFGTVSVLVLNSGGPAPGPAAALVANDVRSACEAMVDPLIECVSLLLPKMRAQGWGRIVAIGSSGVREPIPNLALSNTARALLAGYLKTLAREVACDGVTVNMVLPGRIDTPRVAQLDVGRARETGITPEEVRLRSATDIPAGRYGTVREFAAVVTFICGELAAYVTGEQISVDGGMARSY